MNHNLAPERRERTPEQNDNKIKPEHLELNKTYPTKWLTTVDS
jgi:hypothetical protein